MLEGGRIGKAVEFGDTKICGPTAHTWRVEAGDVVFIAQQL
jgi:hypothetical protein